MKEHNMPTAFANAVKLESDQAFGSNCSLQEIYGKQGHTEPHDKYIIHKLQTVGNLVGEMFQVFQHINVRKRKG